MPEILIHSLEEIDHAAREFLHLAKGGRIFAFYAPMGTGKTTFIRAITRQLGIEEVVNSPTFAIANRYSVPDSDEKVYHIDCYRLETLQDALNLGFEEYLLGDELCFIEWPEVVEPLLPAETLKVTMKELPTGERSITFDAPKDQLAD